MGSGRWSEDGGVIGGEGAYEIVGRDCAWEALWFCD